MSAEDKVLWRRSLIAIVLAIGAAIDHRHDNDRP